MKNQDHPIAPRALSHVILSVSSKAELKALVTYYQARHSYFHRQTISRSKVEKLLAIDAGVRTFQDLENLIDNKRYLERKGNALSVMEQATRTSPVFSHAYHSSRTGRQTHFDVAADFLRLVVTIDGQDVNLHYRLELFNSLHVLHPFGVHIATSPVLSFPSAEHALFRPRTQQLDGLSSPSLAGLLPFNHFGGEINTYTKLYDLFDTISAPLSRDRHYNKLTRHQRGLLRQYKATGIRAALEHCQHLAALKTTVTVKHAAISQQYQRGGLITTVVYDKEIASLDELRAEAMATLTAFHQLAASVNLEPGVSY
uniref:hypothetical protein n=1 Tax=Thaumasiovibrio occultus TaxID=1891184 RepID=UPI000B34D699|nr:hypothetical protein [Thaumasiovibrio occultus]